MPRAMRRIVLLCLSMGENFLENVDDFFPLSWRHPTDGMVLLNSFITFMVFEGSVNVEGTLR